MQVLLANSKLTVDVTSTRFANIGVWKQNHGLYRHVVCDECGAWEATGTLYGSKLEAMADLANTRRVYF